MKNILFCFFILQINLLANNWILVEEFDNTSSVKNSDVKEISCIDDSNCYALIQHGGNAVESNWRLYKSSNAGITWLRIYNSPNIYEEENPQVLNVKSGIANTNGNYFVLSDDNTIIMKSNDSGKTFKKVILDKDNHNPDQFAMFDTSIGFVTNSNSIYITKNGWDNFERHSFLGQINVYSPQFLDSNTLVMTLVSNNNPYGFAFVKYYIKENRFDTLSFLGFNSGADQTANDFQRIYNIYFVNDTLGFGCGSSRVHQGEREYFDMIFRTTDGGYTWKTVFRELYYPEVGLDNNISFADEKNGIAVGFYGKIAMTNDGGDTWVYEPTPNEMDNCRKMQVCWAGHTPLIGTWDAGIFRYEGDFFKFPEDTTSVVDDLITNYQLLITPNPAGNYIEIHYKNVETSLRPVSTGIAIYNVVGECVILQPELSLQGEGFDFNTQPPNPDPRLQYSRKVDISELPSGVYFIRIEHDVKMFVKE